MNVYVYKSLTYSGGAPRLILNGNNSMGYKDTVLAISVSSNNTWELLSSTIPTALTNGIIEIYVDCYGSMGSGSINIDEWSFS